jgi:hypothetical protein
LFVVVEEIVEPGAGAPAIPFEILGPGLEQFVFSHRFVPSLDHDQDFRNLQFRNQQISFLNRFALREPGFELSSE